MHHGHVTPAAPDLHRMVHEEGIEEVSDTWVESVEIGNEVTVPACPKPPNNRV